jgi:phenylacetate-CoA ligase
MSLDRISHVGCVKLAQVRGVSSQAASRKSAFDMSDDGRPATLWDPSIETLAADEWHAREEALLSRQSAYVLARSRFYQTKFAGVGCISNRSELAQLPFTEKDELRDSQEAQPPFGDYLAASPADVSRVHKTSGTTGRPLYIGLTRRDMESTHECGARAFYAAGLRRGDRIVHCLNYQLWAGGVTDHLSLERAGATVVPFGVGNTQGLLRTIRDLKINAISSTPSYLVHLADLLRDELHIEPHELGLRKGFFGGEPGLQIPSVRENIERTWKLRAMDANYGMADVLSIFGSECDVREGLHFHGQGAILVELIDPHSARPIELKTGASGEFVFTNLVREAQPLVRYRSHDAVEVVSTEPCACGRTSFRFRVLGRSDDMLHVRGVNVFPTAVAEILALFPDQVTGEFQIVLTTPPPYNELPLCVEIQPTVSTDEHASLEHKLFVACQQRLSFRAAIELVPPGALPRTQGKSSRVHRSFER